MADAPSERTTPGQLAIPRKGKSLLRYEDCQYGGYRESKTFRIECINFYVHKYVFHGQITTRSRDDAAMFAKEISQGLQVSSEQVIAWTDGSCAGMGRAGAAVIFQTGPGKYLDHGFAMRTQYREQVFELAAIKEALQLATQYARPGNEVLLFTDSLCDLRQLSKEYVPLDLPPSVMDEIVKDGWPDIRVVLNHAFEMLIRKIMELSKVLYEHGVSIHCH